MFFRIYGNKFSYIRKFYPFQTRWECGFCGRVFLCPKKGALTGEGIGPICGGTRAFAPRKKKGKCGAHDSLSSGRLFPKSGEVGA